MKVLVVDYVISWKHAMRILKFFKKKPHSGMGYSFTFQELGKTNDWRLRYLNTEELRLLYADYNGTTELFRLTVYREK